MNKQVYNEWVIAMHECESAFGKGDFDKANNFKLKADMLFESARKEDAFFKRDIKNFGLLNSIIEGTVTEWAVEDNKKPMAEYIKLIKEDSNLKNEYKFYQSMKNYTTSAPSREYVKDCLNAVKQGINEESIQESNEKLIDFMKKHHITKNVDMISENKKCFYNACQYILEHKSTPQTLANLYDNIASVAEYIECNPRKVVAEKKDIRQDLVKTINEFNNKYSMMNGATTDMFNILIESTDGEDETSKSEKVKKKQTLLDNMKDNCIKKINELEEEAETEEEKSKISDMKAMVNGITYNESTLIQDVAKLIEMQSVLYDN